MGGLRDQLKDLETDIDNVIAIEPRNKYVHAINAIMQDEFIDKNADYIETIQWQYDENTYTKLGKGKRMSYYRKVRYYLDDLVLVRSRIEINAKEGEGKAAIVINKGEMGKVVDILEGDKKGDKTFLVVEFGSTRVPLLVIPDMRYDKAKKIKAHTNQITHAYAVTCHRAQGGEWDHVIFSHYSFDRDRKKLTQKDASFINRNMIYTAVSRSIKEFHLYSNDLDTLCQLAKFPAPQEQELMWMRLDAEC